MSGPRWQATDELFREFQALGRASLLYDVQDSHSGNMALRRTNERGEAEIVITATGSQKGDLEPNQICFLSATETDYGYYKASSETDIHARILALPGVRASMHAHLKDLILATLEATLDWSWELLHPWERAAVAQASVFEGGFTLEQEGAYDRLLMWAWKDPSCSLPLDEAVLALTGYRLPDPLGHRHHGAGQGARRMRPRDQDWTTACDQQERQVPGRGSGVSNGQSDHSAFCCALIGGVHERHRSQIVPPTEFGLRTVLQGDEEIRHRSDKSIGEPAFAPDRAFEMLPAFGSVADC